MSFQLISQLLGRGGPSCSYLVIIALLTSLRMTYHGWLLSTKWAWVSFCTSLETARLLWNCPWDDGIWLIFKHHLLRNVKGIFPLINLIHLYLFQVFIKGSNKILNYFPLKFIFLLMRSHILLKHTHINCLVYKTNWVFYVSKKINSNFSPQI